MGWSRTWPAPPPTCESHQPGPSDHRAWFTQGTETRSLGRADRLSSLRPGGALRARLGRCKLVADDRLSGGNVPIPTWVLDFEAGELAEGPSQAAWSVIASAVGLLGLCSGLENLGSSLRRGSVRYVAAAGERPCAVQERMAWLAKVLCSSVGMPARCRGGVEGEAAGGAPGALGPGAEALGSDLGPRRPRGAMVGAWAVPARGGSPR